MAGLVLIVFAMSVVAIISSGMRSQRNEAWRKAAKTLELQFDPGSWTSSAKLTGRVAPGRVTVDTFTRGSGKSSTSYTRYRVRYRRPLGLGLRITAEGAFSGVTKFFGAQDIEIGDPGFDDMALIKGTHEHRIAEFLTPVRRLKIRRAFAALPGLRIDDAEVYWEQRGVTRDHARLIMVVRRLSSLSDAILSIESSEPLSQSLRARADGDIRGALKHLNTAAKEKTVPDPDLELATSELLYVQGDPRAAAEAIVDDSDSEDLDRIALRQHAAQATPPPIPVRRRPPPLGTQETPESTTPPAPAGDTEVRTDATAAEEATSIEAVCQDLFAESTSFTQRAQRFETAYQGQRVRWAGTLSTVTAFTFDLVFGDEPGVRAKIVIRTMESRYGGKLKIQAIVQFPGECLDALNASAGSTIAFEGTLVRADGLMRNVFVSDGVLLSD